MLSISLSHITFDHTFITNMYIELGCLIDNLLSILVLITISKSFITEKYNQQALKSIII